MPNWNGARFLRGCLDSLLAQTYPNCELIVVDGGSVDESCHIVSTEFPSVRLIALPKNRGFAGNVNAGIRAARGSIIALLNNDAEAESEWLAELVAGLGDDPCVGMCASKMLLYDRRDVINSAGDLYSLEGLPSNRGAWEQDDGQYDQGCEIFGASAGAAAYRRAMLEAVGLFDERFFAYCEDVDLSFRAQLMGYRCWYAPTARVYHRLSATGGGSLASYCCGRNFLWVLVKNVPASVLWRHWPGMLRAQLRLALESLRHVREPAARARLRGQLAGLLLIPFVLGERRRIQRSRAAPDQHLLELLDSSRARRVQDKRRFR